MKKLFLTCLLLLLPTVAVAGTTLHGVSFGSAGGTTDFVFTITTSGDAETFTIPCQNVGTFNATVTWGDGSSSTITAYNDADLAHEYASAGNHTISISGSFPNICFNNTGDKLKIISITNLGNVGWTRFNNAFYGCSNLVSVSGSADTSLVTTFENAFRGCSSLTTVDTSGWDTSSVTTFAYAFNGCSSLTTLDTSNWDTGLVTTFAYAFYSCSSLTTLDTSGWDTANVTTLNATFRSCTSLATLDTSSWDTSSVTTFAHTFDKCPLTTLDTSSWDTICSYL